MAYILYTVATLCTDFMCAVLAGKDHKVWDNNIKFVASFGVTLDTIQARLHCIHNTLHAG